MVDTKYNRSPIAIGGMGGSGTRLVAEIVRELGVNMGGDLNAASDNLWFTLLFKRSEILTLPERDFSDLLDLFICRMNDQAINAQEASSILEPLFQEHRVVHTRDWLKERAESFMRPETICDSAYRWGWKEPNTHIVLDRLYHLMPNMKYIHVVRNGLDMAYSSNQNQLVQWGEFILGEKAAVTPSSSLRYWCAMHRRVLKIAKQMGENQFILLNYDALCAHPQQELPKLLEFLEVEDRSVDRIASLTTRVKLPQSIGRFREHGLEHFCEDDIAFVKQMNFDIGEHMNEQPECTLAPIGILGMHRSGTSCLAGSLQEAGIYLGDVVTSAPHNQKGNRENLALRSLNDEVLDYSGGAWNDLPASCQWTREHQVQRDSLMKSFQESTRRWGFKDPRTLGTLAFWQDSTIPFQWVGTFRHPLCVAKSLIKRQPIFSMTQALNLWRDYNERLLALYEQEAFPLVNFSVTNEEYIAQLKKVFEELGIKVESNTFTASFYDETLRHHLLVEKDSTSVPDEFMDVYYKLEQCRRGIK